MSPTASPISVITCEDVGLVSSLNVPISSPFTSLVLALSRAATAATEA
jgi:hypothetical protein